MEEHEDWLLFICPSCKKKNKCFYGNRVFLSCPDAKRIIKNILAGNIGYIPSSFELNLGWVTVVCHYR